MKILVSNIGSTSFKFRLFEMETETEMVSGGADRIGQKNGIVRFRLPGRDEEQQEHSYSDHGEALRDILRKLVESSVLESLDDLAVIAFKAVMGGDAPPVTLVTEEILSQMEYFAPVAPAHNPPYVAAMRMFAEVLEDTLLVTAFDSGFHQTNPDRRRRYAVPPEWAERYGVKRYGYHGASHRYTAGRIKELQPEADRIISCHLGGSSSICAIKSGVSIATSMGLSPQSGLPQGSRVGDFDPFALDLLRRGANLKTDEILRILGSESGLQALSGTSGDMRDIEEAMDQGSSEAALAFDVYVTAIRDYLGAYLVELGGADVIAFTGGIGQKSDKVRKSVCRGLPFAGICLDLEKNRLTRKENRISSEESTTAVWVLESNEELVVARQAAVLLNFKKKNNNSAG
ncbi:MAG: acetate/propionate family kinase [Acidobacteriota bacterium]